MDSTVAPLIRRMILPLLAWQRILAISLLWFGSSVTSDAQTFTTLAVFNGTNGSEPGFLLQGSDGRLWGSAFLGGQSNCGEVFKMTLLGKLTKGLIFNCTDGNEPQGLTLGTDGNYYGLTFSGGSGSAGTVFKLTPTGSITTLHNFLLDGSDGSGPVGTLVQGRDGSFYGATYAGGTSLGYGTLFKITPSGNLTTLYEFDFTHGAQPYAGMIQGTDGNFYGTTYSGGTSGTGTVYKITPQGQLTVLYNFGSPLSDGVFPVTPLIQGTNGNFYGVTPYGGPDDDGTVFMITPAGSLTILHSFVESDGRWPTSLIQASDTSFYGATAYGGADDAAGTLFTMTSSGTVTTLHNFAGSDGSNPDGLIQDTNGTIYGVTGGGGNLNCDPTYGCGTIFSVGLDLNAFVKTIPAAGKVGTKVTILGTKLSGASSVTFNGTSAGFKVVSASEIKTEIPAGATTGSVEVVTPNGTLVSSTLFQVLP